MSRADQYLNEMRQGFVPPKSPFGTPTPKPVGPADLEAFREAKRTGYWPEPEKAKRMSDAVAMGQGWMEVDRMVGIERVPVGAPIPVQRRPSEDLHDAMKRHYTDALAAMGRAELDRFDEAPAPNRYREAVEGAWVEPQPWRMVDIYRAFNRLALVAMGASLLLWWWLL